MLWNNYSTLIAGGSSNVIAVVNPLSGAGADPDAASRRVAFVESRLASAGIRGRVHVTTRAGHARELAARAAADRMPLVIAWGGDGTINEVAGAIAGTETALGVVPAGSGNGFANEIGIPRQPGRAIDVALTGATRAIDAGEIDRRLFFNIAGIGFDAGVAELFNACEQGRRGLGPYLRIAATQAFRYRARRYRIELDSETLDTQALLVVFANGREYGNGMRLAPHASMEDGLLEAVVVDDRRPLARLWDARHLMLGTADRAPGLTRRSIRHASVETDGPMTYHADGEIGRAEGRITVAIHPGLLRVRVPPGAEESKAYGSIGRT
jgi:diacylglycerol kinase (ATP)